MGPDGGGWKLFAAFMILIGGVFNVFDGLVGISQTDYIERFTDRQLPITNSVLAWSWVILGIGSVMIIAGLGILAGNMLSRVIGVVAASVNALVQLAYVNHNPFWSFTVVLIDIMVIYALVLHGGLTKEQRAFDQAAKRA